MSFTDKSKKGFIILFFCKITRCKQPTDKKSQFISKKTLRNSFYDLYHFLKKEKGSNLL